LLFLLLNSVRKLRKLTKKNFNNYFLIYLNSNFETLTKFDSRKIYKKNLNKKKPNIVGYDIKWEGPKKPHLEIKDFILLNKKSINEIIKSKIIKKLKI